jgi:hypothetical protein
MDPDGGREVKARVLLALLALPALAAAEEPGPPALAGTWILDRAASDDVAAKVRESAGSQYVKGAKSWGSETLLPWGSDREDERILLRDLLLDGLRVLERMEIEQTPTELRTIHGEDGLRVFYLERAGTGTGVFTGEKQSRRVRWKGNQLFLEAKSGKSKVKETLTLASPDRLVHELHADLKLFERPLVLKLVYARAGGER